MPLTIFRGDVFLDYSPKELLAAAAAKNARKMPASRLSLTPLQENNKGPMPKSPSQQTVLKERKPPSELGSAIDRFASIAFPMVGPKFPSNNFVFSLQGFWCLQCRLLDVCYWPFWPNFPNSIFRYYLSSYSSTKSLINRSIDG